MPPGNEIPPVSATDEGTRELPFADDAFFLRGIASFLEAHGRDEGGYSNATRSEFQSDADRLREIANRIVQRRRDDLEAGVDLNRRLALHFLGA